MRSASSNRVVVTTSSVGLGTNYRKLIVRLVVVVENVYLVVSLLDLQVVSVAASLVFM